MLRNKLLIIALIFLNCNLICAQNKNENQINLKGIALEIIQSAKYCTLITLDEKGSPQARIMDAFLPDENFIIWFGTNPKSRKIEQIKKDARVTLFYFDKESKAYVTIKGQAKVVDDNIQKNKRFKKEWKQFYKNKKEDFTLIKVTPNRLEVISEKHKIFGNEDTWKPPHMVFKKK